MSLKCSFCTTYIPGLTERDRPGICAECSKNPDFWESWDDLVALRNQKDQEDNYLRNYPKAKPKVSCRVCGTDISTYLGGDMKECANCWEVENRLEGYLLSTNGQKFVFDCLVKRGFLHSKKT